MIFTVVNRLQQAAQTMFFFYPGIVAGSDVIAAEVLRVGEKFLELDFAVT